MEKYINDYKKKDVKATAQVKTRNEIKSSSGDYKTSSTPSVKTQEETKKKIIIDSDGEIDDETDDDDSITDDEDLTSDDVDSDSSDSVTIDEQMKRIRYQNKLLLFRLEQIEEIEKRLKIKLQAMKEEASKEEMLYAKKIAALESALKKKTELLINALREKG